MKKVLLGIGAFIAIIIVVGIVAVKFLVNEELIKDNLIEQAKQFTQQDVAIEGDLNLTFYPQIGFELGKITLFNKHAYADSKQIDVNNVQVAVELMSLFTKTIVVTNVEVDGFTVNIETLADGRNNMDELLATLVPAEKPLSNEDIQATKVTPEGEIAQSEYKFVVKGVNISNAQVSLNNRQDGTYHKLSDSSLTMGEFAFDKPVDIKLAANYRTNELTAKLNTSLTLTVDALFNEIKLTQLDNKLALTGAMLPRPEMNISLLGDVIYDNANKTVTVAGLKLAVDELNITGDLSADIFAKPSLEYNLAMNTLVVDDWLPKAETASSKGAEKGASKGASKGTASTKQDATKPAVEVEPDLSALSSVNQQGTLTITKIKQGDYVLDNIKIQNELKDGVLQLTKLSSDLYGGKLMVKALLDSNKKPATFNLNSTLENVQSEKIVTIAAGKKMLTGLVDVDVRLSGKGLTMTKLKSVTKGTINTSFTDGAVLGVNVAQEVRKAIAMFSKKSTDNADKTNETEQTDFSAMVANFKLGSGKLTSTKIDLASPAIKVDGKGYADLMREKLDFTFNASVAENIGGQSSSTMKAVRDLRLPIDVKGNFAAPSIKFDFSDITQQVIELEKDKLMDKYLGSDEKKDELKSKLFKEFKRLF